MTTESATVARVEFVSAPPGLHPITSFALEEIPGATGLHTLRAVGQDVRLFALDPSVIGHVYRPGVLSSALAAVAAEAPEDVRILLVANPTADGVWVNLRAPILVHRATGRATQTILEDPMLPIRLLLEA